MDADWSVELAQDDPVLEMPWAAPDGSLRYVDLRAHPESLEQLSEARDFPELAEFLQQINGARSVLETAKCSAWETTEIELHEKIFGAANKVGSYCDVIFREAPERYVFDRHEMFAKKLSALLRHAPDIPASAEFVVRRCVFREGKEMHDGFAISLFLFGYGSDAAGARRQWGIALKLVANAMLQAGNSED